jgi:molybdenum cofactor cytidylyltransferase
MLPGVILAGGASVRMGSPKALLADDRGLPFVVRLARTMAEAGIPELVVVSGYEHDSIIAAVSASAKPGVRVVRNEDPSRGQLSSLWTAMDEVCRPETEAIVVMLVDVPLVAPATVRTVIDAWRSSRAPIVRPAVGARRGHPVVFDRSVFDELRRAPLDEGARAVVRAHARDILDVPVADAGCLKDIDTPEDYETHVRRDG